MEQSVHVLPGVRRVRPMPGVRPTGLGRQIVRALPGGRRAIGRHPLSGDQALLGEGEGGLRSNQSIERILVAVLDRVTPSRSP